MVVGLKLPIVNLRDSRGGSGCLVVALSGRGPYRASLPLLGVNLSCRRAALTAAFDPMYGPAVRRKGIRRSGGCGLASMYPAFVGAHGAPGRKLGEALLVLEHIDRHEGYAVLGQELLQLAHPGCQYALITSVDCAMERLLGRPLS